MFKFLEYLNPRNLTIADWYIAGWCLYYLQGAYYDRGGIISISVLSILIVFSLYNFIRANVVYYIPIYLKGLNIFLYILIIYGIINLIGGTEYSAISGKTLLAKNYLQEICTSLLPIYPFYVYSLEGKIKRGHLFIWAIILVFVTRTIWYYQDQTNGIQTNNASYYFLELLPFLLFLRKNIIIQFIMLAYSCMFILAGTKRGAILIMILSLLIILYYSLHTAKQRYKHYVIFLIAVFCTFATLYTIHHYNNTRYFREKFEETKEGDSSGRDVIYAYFWNYYKSQQDYSKLVFGNGAFATARIYKNFAHNDWLELLIDNGILGIIVYIAYWLCFLSNIFKSKNKECFYGLGLIFFIFLLKTVFSSSFTAMMFYTDCALGYFLANYNKTEDKLEKEDTLLEYQDS